MFFPFHLRPSSLVAVQLCLTENDPDKYETTFKRPTFPKIRLIFVQWFSQKDFANNIDALWR